MLDLACQTVSKDLASGAFQSGVIRGNWEVYAFQFPELTIGIKATEPDGTHKTYYFRYVLDDFPTSAPWVRIWDIQKNGVLPPEDRPKGNAKVERTFQHWHDDTVYLPWERKSLAHNNWATTYAKEAWRPDMTLTHTVEELYEILNANLLVAAVRAKAQA